jgi:hypothetical protein
MDAVRIFRCKTALRPTKDIVRLDRLVENWALWIDLLVNDILRHHLFVTPTLLYEADSINTKQRVGSIKDC